MNPIRIARSWFGDQQYVQSVTFGAMAAAAIVGLVAALVALGH